MKTSAMNLRRDPARTASRKTTVRKKREAQATAKAFKGRGEQPTFPSVIVPTSARSRQAESFGRSSPAGS